MHPSLTYWRGARVLITGHTGFKGAWLSFWLRRLGAEVAGYALPPASPDGLYARLELEARGLRSTLGDLAERHRVQQAVRDFAPDMVWHLAAQSLVPRGYADPVGAIATNVLGTAHLLEACRTAPSVRGVVVVTSDKCYRHDGLDRAYREEDPLGGDDPYSASKAAADLIAQSYRASFLEAAGVRLATARAGNVMGAGDDALGRLIPDAVRAWHAGKALVLRRPQATRPWQHVADPLWGYLRLGHALCIGDPQASHVAYNFGPSSQAVVSVQEVVTAFSQHWRADAGCETHIQSGETPTFSESPHLRLDARLAQDALGWRPLVTLQEALADTAAGYQALATGEDASAVLSRTLSWVEERIHATVDIDHGSPVDGTRQTVDAGHAA